MSLHATQSHDEILIGHQNLGIHAYLTTSTKSMAQAIRLFTALVLFDDSSSTSNVFLCGQSSLKNLT